MSLHSPSQNEQPSAFGGSDITLFMWVCVWVGGWVCVALRLHHVIATQTQPPTYTHPHT